MKQNMLIKQAWSKILVPVIYSAAILVMVLFQWNTQISVRRGGSGPLYHNLMEEAAYLKRGFNPEELASPLDVLARAESGGEWVRFGHPPLRIMDSKLPNLPKRRFLSPWGNAAEEFTIIIKVDMDDDAMALIGRTAPVLPGMYFGLIGENWEIFVNGIPVRSEMHLEENSSGDTIRIKSRRSWRDVYFPLARSLLVPGTNVLTLRIVGDPAYCLTGLYYNTPYYIDEWRIIEKQHQNHLLMFFCGIFAFIGIYYLVFFIFIRKKQELFILYYAVFSLMLCIYSFSGKGIVNGLFPDSDISIRVELASLFILLPMLGFFVEKLARQKITGVTRCFFGLSLFFAFTQCFFCNQYGEEINNVWLLFVFIYFSYIFLYDIVYFYFWDLRKKRARQDAGAEDYDILSNLLVGLLIVYTCGIFDILDVLFFHNYLRLFMYSTFVFHIGMAFTLLKRFRGIQRRLEQSHALLEIAVYERTLELEKQTEIAVQASRAKSRFLANMSHEIRTPLNAVIGLSEIELNGELPKSSRKNIVQIYQSGSSLLGIINDILDISKIEAGGFELVMKEFETASMISDTVNLNKVRIGSKPIIFILDIRGDFPGKLLGDELRVKQILNNLLSNAIKFTKEGSVTLCADWEKSQDKAKLRFTVKDSGRGIRPEDIGKLFSSYTQLDTQVNRNIEGTGLGLMITKELAEMMGGSISVESEYGRGSAFSVELFLGLVDSSSLGEEIAESLRSFRHVKAEKNHGMIRSRMPHGRVLVVDDMRVNLVVARGLLEPYGLHIDTAQSGQEAIELIKASAGGYDLVFMDHMMPGMDGIEAVKIIRAWESERGLSEGSSGIPIIALTANALVGNQEMFLSNGFNGFIPKPIDLAQLDEALNKWVGKE